MKKTLPKKKLQLRRTTIANLTPAKLKFAVGGITGPTEGASIQSAQVDDKVVPCQIPLTEP
jgi:hypothetical protein